MHTATSFARAIWIVAATKSLLGVAGGVTGLAADSTTPRGQYLLFLTAVVVFSSAGALLLVGGRRDPRAGSLGVSFLLVGSVFADQLVPRASLTPNTATVVVQAIMALQADAFTPYFVWRFVSEFPRTLQTPREVRDTRWMSNTSAIAGAVLFAANVIAFAVIRSPQSSSIALALHVLQRQTLGGLYWPIEFALTGVAMVVLFGRARRATVDERRRTGLLATSLLVGTGPTIFWVLWTELVPGMIRLVPMGIAGWIIYPTLFSTPLTTAYAVLVRRALDVRVVVRRALQYALTRYAIIVALVAPAFVLAVALYTRRDTTLADLLASRTSAVVLPLAALTIGAVIWRESVFRLVDRRFFREQYDGGRVLARLVDRSRRASDLAQLAEILKDEIQRALQPTRISVLVPDTGGESFFSSSGNIRPLVATSSLAALLGRSEAPLDLDFEGARSPIPTLPHEELHWVVDGDFRLLVPIKGSDRRLLCIIALGERRSELPYSSADSTFLREAAAAAEMAIAYCQLAPVPESASEPRDDHHGDYPAAECIRCGAVDHPEVEVCAKCAGPTIDAVVPHTVAGKFVVQQRIGAGGMGVVYEASDVTLDRRVAIKTLPLVAPREAMRLRREAQAMATVLHSNLALIFGIETWHGQPMLIVEHLPGGTLAGRIRDGPLPLAEVLDVAIAIADGLEALHRVGMLHGDVKPSNIGFAADGTPKLLDFGLARLLTTRTRVEAPASHPGGEGTTDVVPSASHESDTTSSDVTFGTPRYMSPEARAGMSPSPGFDLWSLGVLLFEAVTGEHPLARNGLGFIDTRVFFPSATDDFVTLMRDALSLDVQRRPQTARELRTRLRSLRSLEQGGAPNAS